MKSLTRHDCREIDRRAMAEYGVPSIVLMENAGRGAAELLMRLNPQRLPTLVVCGPGNNGGDGFVVARQLDNHGWPVMLYLAVNANSYHGDAKCNFEIAVRSEIPFEIGFPGKVGWIVDALFGTGLKRPIDDPIKNDIENINNNFKNILALDIPSGLDCDTAEPLGVAVKATHTATFVGRKKGFDNPASLHYTGEVHVIDIGAPRILVDQYIK